EMDFGNVTTAHRFRFLSSVTAKFTNIVPSAAAAIEGNRECNRLLLADESTHCGGFSKGPCDQIKLVAGCYRAGTQEVNRQFKSLLVAWVYTSHLLPKLSSGVTNRFVVIKSPQAPGASD